MADTVKQKIKDAGKAASEAAQNVGEAAKAAAKNVAAKAADATKATGKVIKKAGQAMVDKSGT